MIAGLFGDAASCSNKYSSRTVVGSTCQCTRILQSRLGGFRCCRRYSSREGQHEPEPSTPLHRSERGEPLLLPQGSQGARCFSSLCGRCGRDDGGKNAKGNTAGVVRVPANNHGASEPIRHPHITARRSFLNVDAMHPPDPPPVCFFCQGGPFEDDSGGRLRCSCSH